MGGQYVGDGGIGADKILSDPTLLRKWVARAELVSGGGESAPAKSKTKQLFDKLLYLALTNSRLWCDSEGDVRAEYVDNGRRSVSRIRSRDYKGYLLYLLWKTERRCVGTGTMSRVIAHLEMMTKYDYHHSQSPHETRHDAD